MTKTKIFTDDETGEKFETVISDFNYDGYTKNMKLIQPLKQDKQTYRLDFYLNGGGYLIDREYDLTPEPAKLVSEAIEALMEWLTNPNAEEEALTNKEIRAREVLNEDN